MGRAETPFALISTGSRFCASGVSNAKKKPLDIAIEGLPKNGGYLLSHLRSTIGDAELNDPVRNGKGWDLSAITTLIS